MVSSVDLINSNLRKENDGVKVAMNNLASELNANFLNNLCTNPVHFQKKKKKDVMLIFQDQDWPKTKSIFRRNK